MMKKNAATVIYIGSAVYGHSALMAYIRRRISECSISTKKEIYCRENDSEIPLLIQHLLEEKNGCESVLIFTAHDTLPLISKILATLGEDTVSSGGNLLYPASVSQISGRSYLYKVREKRFNVIEADSGKTLSEILLGRNPQQIKHIFVRPEDEEEFAETIRSLRSLPLLTEWSRIVPGWYRMRFDPDPLHPRSEDILGSFCKRSLPAASVAGALIRYMAYRGENITFAESCTGGLLASAFVSEAGASDILKGSYVAYSNEIKSSWLGVKTETLEKHGAVSEECVLEMAAGARERLSSDIAVAVSGIAGPGGAVPGKPVGTVYICLNDGEKNTVNKLMLEGDRNMIREMTVRYALKMLIENDESIFDFFRKIS